MLMVRREEENVVQFSDNDVVPSKTGEDFSIEGETKSKSIEYASSLTAYDEEKVVQFSDGEADVLPPVAGEDFSIERETKSKSIVYAMELNEDISKSEGEQEDFNFQEPEPMDLPVMQKSSQTRPLDVFVFQQNANGAFSFTPDFISSAGLKNSIPELTSSIPSLLQQSQVVDKVTVWATVIALVVFQRQFQDLKDEWELIFDKSKKFILSKLKGHNITLAQLEENAKSLLKF